MTRIAPLLTFLLAVTAIAQVRVTNEAGLRAALESGPSLILIHDGPIEITSRLVPNRNGLTIRGIGDKSALVMHSSGQVDSDYILFPGHWSARRKTVLRNLTIENLTLDYTLLADFKSDGEPHIGCLRAASFFDPGMDGLTVRRCTFHIRSVRGWDGVRVYVLRVGPMHNPVYHPDSYRVRNILIEHNRFTDTVGQQIQVDRVEHAVVRRNVVINPGQDKRGRNTIFRIIGARDVIYEHNYLFNRAERTAGTAVYIAGLLGEPSRDITVRWNVIDTDAPGQALRLLFDLENVVVEHNVFRTPGRTGTGLEFYGPGDRSSVWLFGNTFVGFPDKPKGEPNGAIVVGNVGLADVLPAELEEPK